MSDFSGKQCGQQPIIRRYVHLDETPTNRRTRPFRDALADKALVYGLTGNDCSQPGRSPQDYRSSDRARAFAAQPVAMVEIH